MPLHFFRRTKKALRSRYASLTQFFGRASAARAGGAHGKVRAPQEETHRNQGDCGVDGDPGVAGAVGDANAVVPAAAAVLPSLSSTGASTPSMRRKARAAAARRISGVKGSLFFVRRKKVARRGPSLTSEIRRATEISRLTPHARQPTTRSAPARAGVGSPRTCRRATKSSVGGQKKQTDLLRPSGQPNTPASALH